MNKKFISTEIFTHADQSLIIQPKPEFDGIELYVKQTEDNKMTVAFYLTKDELPVIIEKLNQMMEYVIKNK